MKLFRTSILICLILPFLSHAASDTKNPCRNLQFYVGNCSTEKNILKSTNSNCSAGSIVILSEMALPQNFVSFKISNMVSTDSDSSGSTSKNTNSNKSSDKSSNSQSSNTSTTSNSQSKSQSSNSQTTSTTQTKTGTTANCTVDLEFGVKGKIYGKYTVNVEAEVDGEQCNYTSGTVSQTDNGSKAQSYQQLTVDNKSRILFGICEGSLGSCACPKI